jgi:hypothetical protein
VSDYGLRIRDAGGNITLTFTDRLTRLVSSWVVSSGDSGSVEISAISSKTPIIVALAMLNSSYFGRSAPHSYTVSGTTVSYFPFESPGGDIYYATETLFLVFLYD